MATINDFEGELFEVAFFSGPTWVVGQDPMAIRSDWIFEPKVYGDYVLKDTAPDPDFTWHSPTPSVKQRILDYLGTCANPWY